MFANQMFVASLFYACIPASGGAIQAYAGKFALYAMTESLNIFKRVLSVLTFIFISAFTACMINATLGISILVLIKNLSLSNVPHAWLTWWIADAVGVVVFTSTIMAFWQPWQEKLSLLDICKIMVTWLLIIIIGYTTLQIEVQLFFLLIPFAIWAAFQFTLPVAVLTGFLISSVCLFGSAYGHAIIESESLNTSILLSQIFISIIFLIILLTHVILSERKKAYANLQLLNKELEKRVQDRTKDLSESNQQLEVQKNNVLKAYEALKQSHARLMQSEKMASLGLLTAGVAHEIKNQLNAMSANIESIKKNLVRFFQFFKRASLDENDQKEINSINEKDESLIAATNEGIKRTAGIVADLSAFARADEPEMVMTNLQHNIESTLNLLSSEIKRVSIVKEFGEIPLVPCHAGKINQVIMNILINAIHALQAQGDGKITIQTESKEGSVIIHIKDNGPGIKKEVLENMFKPFFTTKKEGFGSGLGLYISQNIIKEHRGTLSVTSEIGKGTEFVITLPTKE